MLPLLVTITVLVKNSVETLPHVLNSLEGQDYPKQRMVIVFVDDLSDDGSYEMLSTWTETHKLDFYKVKLFRERTNIPQARNIGLKEMEGEAIVFWDSDIVAPPNALSSSIKLLFSSEVIGAVFLPRKTRSPSILERLFYERLPTRPTYVSRVGMDFTSIKRVVVDKIGFFDEKLSTREDVDYSERMIIEGYKLLLDPVNACIHLKTEKRQPTSFTKLLIEYAHFSFFGASYTATKFLRLRSFGQVLRQVYYMAYPVTFLLTTLSVITDQIVPRFPLIVYLLFPLIYQVLKRKDLWLGFAAATLFTMSGILTAYGVVYLALKDRLKR